MANPYVVVVGNVCAGKTTFVDRFSISNKGWYSLPEIVDERQMKDLNEPDADYLRASFFVDYYMKHHFLSLSIPGPMIQESCLETSSLFPDAYYKANSFSQEKYDLLKSRYSAYLKTLPRPDFYVYLYAPIEVLLKRADQRKEPSRTLSRKLIPIMQHQLENWVEKHVNPNTLLKINTHDVNAIEIDRILASVRELQSATEEELDALLPSVLDRAFKGEL